MKEIGIFDALKRLSENINAFLVATGEYGIPRKITSKEEGFDIYCSAYESNGCIVFKYDRGTDEYGYGTLEYSVYPDPLSKEPAVFDEAMRIIKEYGLGGITVGSPQAIPTGYDARLGWDKYHRSPASVLNKKTDIPKDVVIRKLTENDKAEVCDFCVSGKEKNDPLFMPADMEYNDISELLDTYDTLGYTFVGAFLKGELVGVAVLRSDDHFGDNGNVIMKTLHIKNLVVAPEERLKGIGKALVCAAGDMFPDRHITADLKGTETHSVKTMISAGASYIGTEVLLPADNK